MPKNITIGVAGHTQHGKTSLVKCLTGQDFPVDGPVPGKQNTSSVQGIEHFKPRPDLHMAFIDIPGCPRFLKGAIRGLCGVDMVILAVAADDGLMPQTLEYLKIIDLLNIPNGLIVLNKADLVDAELLEYAEMEILDAADQTILAGKPVIPFSCALGTGKDELMAALIKQAETIRVKPVDRPFRLWIDHVNSFAGIGTVACGTVLSGSVSQDDILQVVPLMMESKARSLEVNHLKTETAIAGQRVGINLPKISLQHIRRGMLLVKKEAVIPGRYLNTQIIAVGFLKDRQRVRLHMGTSVSNVMIILMENASLEPGQSGLASLRLETPLFALPFDRFVISQLNTQIILGGGLVLELTHQKFRAAVAQPAITYLSAVLSRDIGMVIECFLRKKPDKLMSCRDISMHTGLLFEKTAEKLESLISAGRIKAFDSGKVILAEQYERIQKNVLEAVKTIISKNPLKPYANKEEIHQRLGKTPEEDLLELILTDLVDHGIILKCESGFIIQDVMVGLTIEQQKIISLLLAYARQMGLKPFSAGGFCFDMNDEYRKSEIQRLLNYLYRQGKLIRLNGNLFLAAEVIDDIKNRVREAIGRKGSVCLADSVEIFGYGRSRAVSVFDYLDEIEFTCRKGNARILKTDIH